MVYCIHMADSLGVDLEEIINSKMDKMKRNIQLKKQKEIAKSTLNCNVKL